MQPIAIDAVWSACLLITTTSCANTTEPTEMTFGCHLFIKIQTMASAEREHLLTL